jgi:hypothetical protein
VKTAPIVRGFFALACALSLTEAAHAATPQPLLPGDQPAIVTVNERPLSNDVDHVVAFKRGKEIYVSLEDMKQMVSGSMKRTGKTFTVHSFRGDTNSRTYVFHIGSAHATAHGQPVSLHAPVVEAYGHVYIPLSFFEADALVTHVRYNGSHQLGDIVIPENYL